MIGRDWLQWNCMSSMSYFNNSDFLLTQWLAIRRILEGVRAKNLQATLLFVDFTNAFDSIHRGKIE